MIISGVVSRADHNIPLSVKLADIMDFNFRHLIALLHNVNEVAGESVFDGLPQDTFSEIYDMKLLSTDRSVRQEGVATHLVRSAVTDAQKRGFKRVKCEATSKFYSGLEVANEQTGLHFNKYGSDSLTVMLRSLSE